LYVINFYFIFILIHSISLFCFTLFYFPDLQLCSGIADGSISSTQTCYYRPHAINETISITQAGAGTGAYYGTTIALIVSVIVIGTVASLACIEFCTVLKNDKKPLQVQQNVKEKTKQKQEEVEMHKLQLQFEMAVAMRCICRFSRIILTPKKMNKSENRMKRLLACLIIRTVCEGHGRLHAVVVSTLITFGGDRKNLLTLKNSSQILFKEWIENTIKSKP
jgi:hypothetical protein